MEPQTSFYNRHFPYFSVLKISLLILCYLTIIMQERLFLCPLCRDRGQDILNVFMKKLTEHDKVAPFVALQSKNE